MAIIKGKKTPNEKYPFTTREMEVAIANYYNTRTNILVPNVSWGLFNYEMDIVVMTPAGYLTEIEIKISRADLKKDLEKRHGHNSTRIKSLYFAIPEKLKHCIDLIPERAGIYVAKYRKLSGIHYHYEQIKAPAGLFRYEIEEIRKPIINKNAPALDLADKLQFYRLGALRIWDLKRTVNKLIMEKKK